MKLINGVSLLSAFLVLLAANGSACSSAPTDQAIRQTPVVHVYTRAGSPNVRVEIHQDPAATPLSDGQLQHIIALLNQLPSQQLQAVHLIAIMSDAYFEKYPGYAGATGKAFGDGGIMVRNATFSYSGQALTDWLDMLRHEIGHNVEYPLPDSERNQWIKLHDGSQVPYDVFSTHSMEDECEDFAETYRFFSSDTETNFKVAVRNAAAGHSKELDKMLFLASLFITDDASISNYDGTVSFYKPDPTDGTNCVPYKVSYVKTKDSFQIDGYIFALSGANITRITDPEGNVLASNISMPLVPPYWPVKSVVTATSSNPESTPRWSSKPVTPIHGRAMDPDQVRCFSGELPTIYKALWGQDLKAAVPTPGDTLADVQRKATASHPVLWGD